MIRAIGLVVLLGLAIGLWCCGDAGDDGSTTGLLDADADALGDGGSTIGLPDADADAAGDAVEPDQVDAPAAIPDDRPVLLFAGDSATEANAAVIPPDWPGIEPTRCAEDPTRVFIGELAINGIDNPQVLYHWAPILPGPSSARPVQGMPEISLAGPIERPGDSSDDVRADHPFGFDFTFDVRLDPEYAALTNVEDGTIHAEIEIPQFPREALGMSPRAGDRALLRGAWVLDCGHPPYGAELHPPTFLAFARAEGTAATSSVALVNPYRIAQLYTSKVDRVTAFDDDSRFGEADTKPFPTFVIAEVLRAVLERSDHLTAPGLMEALRFDVLSWAVCAPLPRPEGTSLSATWRFTLRTGVSLSADVLEGAGCVYLEATMDDSYVPMPLVRGEVDWPWDELSESAGEQLGQPIDVRRALLRAVEDLGYTIDDVPALAQDHPPRVDHYEPLLPLPGADRDTPTEIVEGADGQPFPFYGRVRVAWE